MAHAKGRLPAASWRKRLRGCFRLLQVQQVVEQVNTRCAQTKRHNAQQCHAGQLGVENLMRRHQGHEQKQVFQPLVNAHGFQQGRQMARTVLEDPDMIGQAAHLLGQPHRGIDHQRSAGVGPDTEIVPVIAGIVKTAASVTLFQRRELGASAQVAAVAAGKHFVKQPRVRNLTGDFGIGGCGQHQITARFSLAAQISRKVLVIGQLARIEFDSVGNLLLEEAPALPDPQRAAQRIPGPGFDQQQQRLQQGVGLAKRSIQVDAQGNVSCFSFHIFF